jgi:hypothetical protein
MEKQIKITPPEGYEIDREKSTFETIIFKKVEEELPTEWIHFKTIEGYYTGSVKSVITDARLHSSKTLWSTIELADAARALCQLVRFRDTWNKDWIPNYMDNSLKYSVMPSNKQLAVLETWSYSRPLVFPSREIANKFLSTFRDLLEIAKPLL